MKRYTPTMLTALGLILGSYGSSFAQDDSSDGDTQIVEEQVIVTGTYIPRQTGNLSSPVAVIDGDALHSSGGNTIADVIQQLTINTGAQNYTDAFTQNVSTGTSNVNLRGLGVSSTLVLLNGKRQVVSGAPTDQGLTFVDISSLIPFIAIARIEIVTDGAAALYGSDAVAGVVNFITRNDFKGIELSARAQTVTEDSQLDLNIGGIVGFGNGRTHFTASFEYMHRTSLTTAERRFPGSLDPVNGDFSNAGFPGSFIVPYLPTGLSPAIQAAWTFLFDSAGLVPGVADAIEPLLGLPFVPGAITPILADPNCAAGDNSVLPSTFPFGFCRLDFGSFFDLVAEEERILGHLTFTHDFNEDVSFFLEASIAINDAKRNNSPSFPVPGPHAVLANVPGTSAFYNPFNPFGLSPVLPGPATLPLFFIGRSVGQGPAAPSFHDSDTWRIHARFDGTFGDNGTWEVSFTHAQNKFHLTVQDVLGDRWDLALNGLGGPGCNPLTGVPGLGGCQFFNPFGTSLTAAPGTTVPGPFGGQIPVVNDPALIAWMTGDLTQDYLSRLTVAEGIITNSFDAGLASPIGYAVGFQYRKNVYNLTWDAQSNADNFLFLLGGPNFATNLDSFSFFGEVVIPFTDRIEMQVALRYEDYGGTIGSSIDPKVGIFAEVSNTFLVRGSFGTSFRAPTGFQLFGTQTSLQQLIDTLPGQPTTPQFFAVRTSGTGALVPEEATNWNFGFTWEPSDRFTLDFDYWWFDFENIIVQESAQAILNANPLDPRIIRSPLTGGVVRIDSNFVNASSLKTSGFDVAAEYRIPMNDHGELIFGFNATHISKYDLIDPQAGAISGAGVRNFNNFGVSTPQWRFVGSANWAVGQHDIFVFVRFIDSYLDDQNNLPISSHTTVDFQYNFYIGDPGDERAWRFSVGVINIFNNFPPTVLTNQGFDTKIHDPRGRMVYGQFTKGF
ncbi:MAG: TonB-dependent receptor [Proteobacteria bacterium]|nr:TonB-dependent receptor [Pseudomonadota bacterium]